MRKSILCLTTLLLAWCQPVFSANEKAVIGTFTRIKGDVAVLSGIKLTTLKKEGASVYEGDRVQTKNGEADIKLKDGAVIKISPYTNGQIQEREEKAGKFTLKTIPVRRVTCSVGKMWIKSGKNSKVKNFIQTPTSVCALRGTEVAFGYVPKAPAGNQAGK